MDGAKMKNLSKLGEKLKFQKEGTHVKFDFKVSNSKL